MKLESVWICPRRTKWLHEEFAKLGKVCKHGVTRLGYSDLESLAHEKFSELILQIPGWEKSVDVFGNTHFTLRGEDSCLEAIQIGSHLDSVNEAGLFDGTSGCLSALLIAEYLNNNGIKLKRDLIVTLWRTEESTRFGAAMVGSRLYNRLMSFGELERITDSKGVSILGGMLSQGLDRDSIRKALKIKSAPANTIYAELHIEQGPELYDNGKEVGIVTGFCGTWRAEISFMGRKDHSSRKNGMRYDAMAAFTKAGNEIYQLVNSFGDEYPVVTIGGVNSDGSMNCIAGKVTFTVDVRGLNARQLLAIGKKIKTIVANTAALFELRSEVKEKGLVKPVRTSSKLQNKMQKIADTYKYQSMRISSGAGHDAMSFALAGIPSIMVFVPSSSRRKNGAFSHSPDECTTWKDLARGTSFLLRTICFL